jgi:hypothetical protein
VANPFMMRRYGKADGAPGAARGGFTDESEPSMEEVDEVICFTRSMMKRKKDINQYISKSVTLGACDDDLSSYIFINVLRSSLQ